MFSSPRGAPGHAPDVATGAEADAMRRHEGINLRRPHRHGDLSDIVVTGSFMAHRESSLPKMFEAHSRTVKNGPPRIQRRTLEVRSGQRAKSYLCSRLVLEERRP